jgi:hypothetical protein
MAHPNPSTGRPTTMDSTNRPSRIRVPIQSPNRIPIQIRSPSIRRPNRIGPNRIRRGPNHTRHIRGRTRRHTAHSKMTRGRKQTSC